MGIASAAAAPPARKGGWMDMDGHSCQAGGLETRSRHGCLSLSLSPVVGSFKEIFRIIHLSRNSRDERTNEALFSLPSPPLSLPS